jgi:hypothetical protein
VATVSISLSQAIPLEAQIGRLEPKEISKIAATRYLELLRRHFRQEVVHRHTSAGRLGASPTGYWANPTTYTELQGETITITKPGIARALREVVIRPRHSRALTLPLHAMAYGKRVADLRHTLGKAIYRPKGARILAYNDDSGLVPLYALVGQVRQPQDPTLLPSEDMVHHAISDAISIYMQTFIKRG